MTKELNLDVKQQEKLKQLLPSNSKSYPEGGDEKKKRTSQGKKEQNG
jgi:hypothetical protein